MSVSIPFYLFIQQKPPSDGCVKPLVAWFGPSQIKLIIILIIIITKSFIVFINFHDVSNSV